MAPCAHCLPRELIRRRHSVPPKMPEIVIPGEPCHNPAAHLVSWAHERRANTNDARLAEVNGATALVIREGGVVTSVIQFGWSEGAEGPRVSAVYMTRNPDKLRALDVALRDGA